MIGKRLLSFLPIYKYLKNRSIMKKLNFLIPFVFLVIGFGSMFAQTEYPEWAIGPFKRFSGNPIMRPQGQSGTWESQNVYNPAVIYRDNHFFMLYRGENSDTTLFKYYRSQIGLAESVDGIHWQRYSNNPVLKAEFDYELPGGLEDPRLVELNGTYYVYYTAYAADNHSFWLCVATSTDLKNWVKHGPIWGDWNIKNIKNGAILMNPNNEPVMVDGKYVLYCSGNDTAYICYSKDLIHWDIKSMENMIPLGFYPWEFCMALTDYEESKENIILFLGSRHNGGNGEIRWNYALGQSLIKKNNLEKIVEIMEEPYLIPVESYEQNGFIHNTLFCESITLYNGEWLLYYGAADHQIALAKASYK